jgi:hypothetical protein
MAMQRSVLTSKVVPQWKGGAAIYHEFFPPFVPADRWRRTRKSALIAHPS